MVHVTDLTGADGLELVNCARCDSSVDVSVARVGTVVDGDVSSSVLLCADCGDDPQTQPWLTHQLTDCGDEPQDHPHTDERSAAQQSADRAKDHLDAAKARVEDAKKFARSADERVRRRRDRSTPEPDEKDDPA